MQKNRQSIRTITTAAMMVAVGVVIGLVCKTTLDFGGIFRITFENVPVILSGILYGPIIGGAVGVLVDLLSCLSSGQSPLPLVAVGSASIGIVSGVVSKYVVKKKGNKQIIISGAAAHIIGSMIIKVIGLWEIYQYSALFRIPIYMAIAPLEICILCMLLNRKSFAKIAGYTEKKMTYTEALDYIHSVSWTFCKPGLDRINELCKRLGNPQKSLKFIHVAGTNGKGSFCSMLSSVLKEAGYKVGTFTSPYVKTFNERMSINGEMISNSALAELTELVKPYADKMKDKPTEFELITAIALEYFKRSGCDYVVLECGLGGRLDSTNIIDTSILSVITGIALDHTSILGETIPEIAMEKSGIIKSGIPVLWCGNDKDAQAVISDKASEMNAPLYEAGREELTVKSQTLDGTVFDYGKYSSVEISLLGTYQVQNATNVLCAVDILKTVGLEISDEAIYNGMKNAKWNARFELISNTPRVIFDGGHNPQGVCEAVASIKKYLGEEKVYTITGVMADKDYEYIASKISEVTEKAFCLTPNNPRALGAKEYAVVFEKNGIEAKAFDTVYDAVSAAMNEALMENKTVLCLGSLYMYAEVQAAVENHTRA